MNFKTTTLIQAPLERVFASMADFENAAQNIEAITKIEILTSGKIGAGTRFRETRKVFGKEATEEMVVTAFEPPRRYVIEAESHGSRYRSEFLFQEQSRATAGPATAVTLTFEALPQTFFAKVMTLLMRPMMKTLIKSCAKDLEDLKRAIEG
jgi:uncharacterized protein YndB with AHSA1/START domain